MWCLNSLNSLFITKGHGEMVAAALAAAAPTSQPGRQLAARLLDFVCCLAEMGPPANCAAAPEAGAAAGDCSIVLCWWELILPNASLPLKPFLSLEAVRSDRGMRLLTALAGLLERLHEQQRQQQLQRHTDAVLTLPMRQAAQARLTVAAPACSFTAVMLASYGGVLENLLPPQQAAGQLMLQGSLLQAARKGLQYAWHAVRSLPHAAALVTAANCDVVDDTAVAIWAAYAFRNHAANAGAVAVRPC